jgi:hypothetical protein
MQEHVPIMRPLNIKCHPISWFGPPLKINTALPAEAEVSVENGTASHIPPVIAKAGRPAVLSDGTYATQISVVEIATVSAHSSSNVPNLRSLLLVGDFFLAGVIAGMGIIIGQN